MPGYECSYISDNKLINWNGNWHVYACVRVFQKVTIARISTIYLTLKLLIILIGSFAFDSGNKTF